MPVSGKTPHDISARAETLKELAYRQLWNPEFVHLDAQFNPKTANILAECYFAMSEAYKREWKLAGRTEWTKVGALTAATIAVVKPLRPMPGSSKVNDVAWAYFNPSFAMFAAYDGIPGLFFARSFDEQRRVLRALARIEMPSLDPIIAEGNANNGVLTSDWCLTLTTQELSFLDLLVSYFVLLKENERLRLERPEKKK